MTYLGLSAASTLQQCLCSPHQVDGVRLPLFVEPRPPMVHEGHAQLQQLCVLHGFCHSTYVDSRPTASRLQRGRQIVAKQPQVAHVC